MPGPILGPGNQYSEQNGYDFCSRRAYSVAGKTKMIQIIPAKSDKCHEMEIRDVIRGYIFQRNLILFRVSHYLRK